MSPIVSLAVAVMNLAQLAHDGEAALKPHLLELDAALATAKAGATSEELELMEADLAFARDAGRDVAEAFASRMLKDGRLVAPDQPVATGPDAVRAALGGGKAQWRWVPVAARADRGLGVTYGIAAISWLGPDGRLQVARTRYTTVWTREPGGPWRIWLDMGNAAPKSPGPVH